MTVLFQAKMETIAKKKKKTSIEIVSQLEFCITHTMEGFPLQFSGKTVYSGWERVVHVSDTQTIMIH